MAQKYLYPDWLTAGIIQGYKSGVPVKEIAEIIAYPEGSVRCKLTREGVYQSKKLKSQTIRATAAEEQGF